LTPELRYTRQVRLAEVGEAGQARLASAHACVHGDGMAADVEARYLRGAGVSVTHATTHPNEDMPGWLLALGPGARDVAAGAYAALSVMRAVLASSPHPRVDA